MRHLQKYVRMTVAAIAAALLLMPAAYASPASGSATPDDTPKLKVKAYEGFRRIVDEYGDTCRLTFIREIVVYPPLKFKNKKEEKFYWRTVRDVRKTLPYAKP